MCVTLIFPNKCAENCCFRDKLVKQGLIGKFAYSHLTSFLCSFSSGNEVLCRSGAITHDLRHSLFPIMVVNSWMSPTCPLGPKETSSVWENSPLVTLRQSQLNLGPSKLPRGQAWKCRLKWTFLSTSFSSQLICPLMGLLEEKKEMGQLFPSTRLLLDCLYLDFFLFSDGWVKRRYRPNVQQFAGRDGSPDSGKFSSLTFKLGEGGQCYQMWFYMTRELSF